MTGRNRIDGHFEVTDKPVETGYGVCPIMSTSFVVPEPVPGGITQSGPPQVAMRDMLTIAPCIGDKCGVWSISRKHCSIVSLAEIADYLEPAQGMGPLGSIAESLAELVDLRLSGTRSARLLRNLHRKRSENGG